MSERTAEKDACDGCQKRPCVCETVVLPTAEKDTPCPVCKGEQSHAAACSVPVLGLPRHDRGCAAGVAPSARCTCPIPPTKP